MHPAMKQLPKESPKCLHTLGGPVHGLRMNEVRVRTAIKVSPLTAWRETLHVLLPESFLFSDFS